MLEDIEHHDNPPEKPLPETEPFFSRCTWCANRTDCPKDGKPWAVEWDRRERRIIGCDAFAIKAYKAVRWFLQIAIILLGLTAISKPDTLAGWLPRLCMAIAGVIFLRWHKAVCKQVERQEKLAAEREKEIEI